MNQVEFNRLTTRFTRLCSQSGINSIDALKASLINNPTQDIIEAYQIYMALTSLL